MTNGVNTNEIIQFLDRVERIEDEIKELNSDKTEIWNEAKGRGFDVKLLRKAHSLRKMGKEDLAVLSLYATSIGVFE